MIGFAALRIHRGRAVAMGLAMAVGVAGCDGTAAPSASPTPTIPVATGIRGVVLLGPTCPTETGGEPCVTPYVAELVIFDRSNVEVARVTSGPDGRFEIALPPGEYTVTPTPGDPFPTALPVPVSVVEGSFTEIEINYESGIG